MQANCPTISWRVLQVKQHDAAITWVVKLAQVTWQLGNLASREPLTVLGRFTAIPFQRTKKGQFFQTLQAALQMVYEGVQSFVHFAAFCLRAEHSHSFIQRYFRFLPLFCSTVMRLCLAFTDASNVSTFSRSYSLTSQLPFLGCHLANLSDYAYYFEDCLVQMAQIYYCLLAGPGPCISKQTELLISASQFITIIFYAHSERFVLKLSFHNHLHL